MFAPDVEARFKRIEDAQVVTAELLHRFEQETRERFRHVEAVQDAMARWIDRMADADAEMRQAHAEMREALTELSRTVDRFLRARANGGEN